MTDPKVRFLNHGPRLDLKMPFYPYRLESHTPIMLNTTKALTACRVAAEVLKVTSERGGTRLMPGAIEELIEAANRGLEPDIINHCIEEAAAVLEWLEFPPAPAVPPPEAPELEIMREGDIEARIATAAMALENEFDLELEFYQPQRSIWIRRRVRPLELQEDPATLIVDDGSLPFPLEFSNIRWLMPVQRRRETESPKAAPVLAFPPATKLHPEEYED